MAVFVLLFFVSLPASALKIYKGGDDADKWVISYSGGGTGSGGVTLSDGTVTSTGGGWLSTPIPGATAGGGGSSTAKLHPTDLGCFANCSGNVTAILTWVASDGVSPAKTPPPKTLCLSETVAATWTLNYGCTDPGVISAQVDDGKKDPTVTNYDPMGLTLTVSSSGIHLVQVDSSSGTVTRTVNMSSSGATLFTPKMSGEFQAFCYYSVNIDNRALTVSRANAHNETVDADGTIHGDTIFSYLFDGQPEPQHQTFQANLIGTWSQTGWWPFTRPDVSASWDFSPTMPLPQTSAPDGLTAFRDSPYGTRNLDFNWQPYGKDDSPQLITVTANVTDNHNGAKATAIYLLTIHDPVETLTHTTAKKEVNVRIADGAYWISNRGTKDVDESAGISKYIEWSVGVSLGNVAAVSSWVLADIGVSLSYTVNIGFQTTSTATISTPPHYRTILMMGDLVVCHTGTANTYDSGGFLGIQPFQFNVPDSPAGEIFMAPPTLDPNDPFNSGVGK